MELAFGSVGRKWELRVGRRKEIGVGQDEMGRQIGLQLRILGVWQTRE
jgi:hypothetical protein